MAKDRRPAEELSVTELERVLARKRMDARQARLDRFRTTGRALELPGQAAGDDLDPPRAGGGRGSPGAVEPERRKARSAMNRVLLGVEVAALLGFAFVLFSGFGVLRVLNREVAEALAGPTPGPTPIISAVVLPSGHTPPTSPGGARPNEDEIPEHLRPLVQSVGEVDIPTPSPEQARSLWIPALWSQPAPVVQGDGWEQLKKGVGQHIGTANPGEAGNLVVSAHNDIFGELFRELDRLQPGDELVVSTSSREYLYRVTGLEIVEPTDVSAIAPTARPTITLISCYPYLVDSQRIVVFGELVES
ncbi:MAG: sortase [Anaerolineales bacterium]|nr:sortase [Anaerolineales bacterium]